MSKRFLEEKAHLTVDSLFKKYDIDHNGYLGADEVFHMINESREHFGITGKLSLEKVDQFIEKIHP